MTPVPTDPILSLDGVTFSYRDGPLVNGANLYKGFSCEIRQASTLGIMGASGCGKSTLARMMAGLLRPREGDVRRGTGLRRPSDVVYVDQHPLNSVFPWQRVGQNIAYPLKKLGWENDRIRERVRQMLSVFKLEALAEALPGQLSGGELQRLAMARSCSWSPRLIVLDEAFAALDSGTKEEVQKAIRTMAIQEDITLVMVTHNVGDVLGMCTECFVIGRRPVEIVTSLSLGAEFPRDIRSASYHDAENTILELVRDGII